MKLPVFETLYTVRIADDPVIHNGRPALAVTVPERRLILISPTCPAPDRLRILVHELDHAARHHRHQPAYHHGPEAGEAIADWQASWIAPVIRAITDQGGPAALLALQADNPDTLNELLPPAGTLADLAPDRLLQCPRCQQRIPPGSVAVIDRRAHPGTSAPIAELAFECPHCEELNVWAEFLTVTGKPNGVCAEKPYVCRGKKLAAFRRRHRDRVIDHPA